MRIARRMAVLSATAAILAGCVTETTLEESTIEPSTAMEAGPSAGQVTAADYVGLDEQDALDLAAERGVDARTGTADDVGEPGQTDDYEVGRLTFVIVDGAVAEVIIETDTGPETVAAG